jgi:ParB family chromosome partitioning protein
MRASVIMRDPAEIEIGGRLRSLDEARVVDLMASVKVIGIKTPISTRQADGKPRLVAGLHRLEVAKRLGLQIPCIDDDGDEIDAERWEIAENLHRAELSALDRADHIARWIELTERRQPAQNAPAVLADGRKAGPQHAPGGINSAARELGIDRSDAQRAMKVAGLSPQAKEAARETGLDDNRSALLRAVKAPVERQEVVIRQIAAERTEKRAAERRPAPGPDFILPERGDSTTPLEQRITEEQRDFLIRLRELAGRHLAREHPVEDAGGALEIMMQVYVEVQNGAITGAKYRAAHPGAAA